MYSSNLEAKSNNYHSNHTYNNQRNNNNNTSKNLNTIGEILKLVKSANENKEQSQSIYEDSYINNNINECCSMMKTNRLESNNNRCESKKSKSNTT
jgi:hypothetical protein